MVRRAGTRPESNPATTVPPAAMPINRSDTSRSAPARLGQQGGPNRFAPPGRNEHSRYPSQRGEQQTLDRQGADEVASGSPEGQAHSDLPSPPRGSQQHQVRHVDHGNQQDHKRHRRNPQGDTTLHRGLVSCPTRAQGNSPERAPRDPRRARWRTSAAAADIDTPAFRRPRIRTRFMPRASARVQAPSRH